LAVLVCALPAIRRVYGSRWGTLLLRATAVEVFYGVTGTRAPCGVALAALLLNLAPAGRDPALCCAGTPTSDGKRLLALMGWRPQARQVHLRRAVSGRDHARVEAGASECRALT
jgi:hypothetical protein